MKKYIILLLIIVQLTSCVDEQRKVNTCNKQYSKYYNEIEKPGSVTKNFRKPSANALSVKVARQINVELNQDQFYYLITCINEKVLDLVEFCYDSCIYITYARTQSLSQSFDFGTSGDRHSFSHDNNQRNGMNVRKPNYQPGKCLHDLWNNIPKKIINKCMLYVKKMDVMK